MAQRTHTHMCVCIFFISRIALPLVLEPQIHPLDPCQVDVPRSGPATAAPADAAEDEPMPENPRPVAD